ncbi:MAG: GNAT family N-acetyltransferase [Omnitrophica WOR_2 bacterium]
MENVLIRQATDADMAFIVESQLKMAFETEGLLLDKLTVTLGVKAVAENPLKGFYIVGESDKALVSCLMITPEWSDWRNNWVWWIQSVYVTPPMRKTGIFGLMYSYIKSLVIEQPDVAGIRLYVDNTNVNAREVYKRIGMNDEHYRLFEWMKN